MKSFTTTVILAAFLRSVTASPAMADGLTYEKDVRPILKAHCFLCHGENGAKNGELDLRLRRFILSGGDSGYHLYVNESGHRPRHLLGRITKVSVSMSVTPARH